MTAEENIRAQIEALLSRGSLPLSACSGSFLKAVQSLRATDVLVEERSGSGRKLVVRERPALQAFYEHRYPNAAVPNDATSRLRGVAQFRRSKVFRSDTPELIAVRAWRNDSLLCDGNLIDVVEATKRHGLFSFLLKGGSAYSLRGQCALVENPTVFAFFEELRVPAPLVLYVGGCVSNRIIDWLAGMTAPDFSVLHMPDYDPAGLAQFERLRARLASVCLHIPSNLDKLFAHSDPTLLDKPNTQRTLAALRSSNSPEVQRVLKLIEHHNAGLEQEALLIV